MDRVEARAVVDRAVVVVVEGVPVPEVVAAEPNHRTCIPLVAIVVL